MEKQINFAVIDEHQSLAMAIIFGINKGMEKIKQHHSLIFYKQMERGGRIISNISDGG